MIGSGDGSRAGKQEQHRGPSLVLLWKCKAFPGKYGIMTSMSGLEGFAH